MGARPQRLAIVVLLGLALSGWLVVSHIQFRTDMGFFLPRFASPDAAFLTDRLRNSPAGNVILLGLSGAPQASLASASDRLTRALRKTGSFQLVSNGRPHADEADMKALIRYRYLLNPEVRKDAFSAATLRRDLEDALKRLGSSAFFVFKELLPRDPTNRTWTVARALARQYGPARRDGVWFSGDGKTALIVLRTKAAALDLTGQGKAINAIEAAVRERIGGRKLQVAMSGPGVFATEVQTRIRSEMWWLGLGASAAVVVIMLLAFRSITVVAVLAVPLAGGMIAGIAAVQLMFGNVHGITLTFGATLMGIAIDYPVHHATHASRGGDQWQTASQIWPTLRISMATTVAGFLPLTFSSFPGMAQLGLICIVGLVVAAVMTRWVLPGLLGPLERVPGSAVLSAATDRLASSRRLRGPALVIVAAVVVSAGVVGYRSVWEGDLSRLGPIPQSMRDLDRRLRADLRAPGPRYLLIVKGATADAALRESEALMPRLGRLAQDGKIGGFEMAAQTLPSAESQRARQNILPDSATLRRSLDNAMDGLAFKAGTFEPFIRDVETARRRRPIGIGDLGGTSLGRHLRSLLFQRDREWVGLVMLSGVKDAGAVRRFAGGAGVRFLDLKAETEELVVTYRNEALKLVAVGAAVALVLLLLLLRRPRDVLQVAAPVALSVLLSASAIVLFGIKLSIFHLLAILVVAGIGLDYALFLKRETGSRARREKTVRSVVLCAVTTGLVFGILSLSTLPVLHGIGLTVAIGAVSAMVMSAILVDSDTPHPAGPSPS